MSSVGPSTINKSAGFLRTIQNSALRSEVNETIFEDIVTEYIDNFMRVMYKQISKSKEYNLNV